MNSRERVLAAFAHKPPDRTPVFEYVLLSPVADAVIGGPYEDFGGDFYRWARFAKETGFEKALRKYARDRVAIAKMLGHDMIYCVPNPNPAIVERSDEELTDRYEPRYFRDDPVEAVARANDAVREGLGRPANTDYTLVYHLLREEMRRNDLDLPLYAPAFNHGVWTNVDLMQTMALDEAVAKEHFELRTRVALRQIEDFIAAGADILGIGGDFAGNRPLISPRRYRDYIAPELKKLSGFIHSRGRLACNASDGDLWGVIDDFLIASGVDAYGEIDQGAGMELAPLKRRFGDRITFFGNMDCGRVLSYCEPERIAEMTVRCIEDGMGNGGHVFTASNAISESVPLANYMAMVNAYKDYFGLKRPALPS